LINNAGVLEPKFLRSHDGYEMTFAVNHLAHFLLTLLLLDFIKSSSPARIVNVSSGIHSSSIDFDNLQGEKTYSGNGAYCLSKLCNVLFTYQLSEKLVNTGVTSNCLHPGVINTKLFRAGWGGGGGASLKNGAKNSVYVATSPELDGVTGKYFVNKRDVPSADISYDSSIQEKLWTISKDLVRL
jgi:NAD(P)-dependent dehydrogenase (short-subunit alcohol dehydrogenase family)